MTGHENLPGCDLCKHCVEITSGGRQIGVWVCVYALLASIERGERDIDRILDFSKVCERYEESEDIG